MSLRLLGTLTALGLVLTALGDVCTADAAEPALVGDGAKLEEDGDELVLVLSSGKRATVCASDPMRFDGWDIYSSTVEAGPAYAKVQCVTTLGSHERVAFVDGAGKVVDLSPLDGVRAFEHTRCIWGAALGTQIVLWDLDYNGSPKECDDGAKGGEGFTVPRHYLLTPSSGAIEKVEHRPACATLDLSSGEYVRCVQPKKD